MSEMNQEFENESVNPSEEPSKVPENPKNKTGKRVKYLVAGALGLVILSGLVKDSVYQIQEQEQAVLTTFGVPKAVPETGLHFKLPLVQKIQKVNTTIQGFPIGYSVVNNEVVESESIMITSDYNFIDVDFFVEYRITEPVKYLYASGEPEEILNNIAQSCILTTGKGEIQSKIKAMILEQMEEQDIGIQLVNITIQDSEPPTQEVMKAFKAVETAKQGKETALNNANKYRNEKLPEAQAQADQIVQDAQAQKQVRINEAEAEVARFEAAKETAIGQLDDLYEKALAEAGEEQAMIFDVHKMMLDDGDYLDAITGLIRSEKVNAEYAVHTTGEQFAAVFASMDDDYMKARSADVKDISGRVIRILAGIGDGSIASEDLTGR